MQLISVLKRINFSLTIVFFIVSWKHNLQTYVNHDNNVMFTLSHDVDVVPL